MPIVKQSSGLFKTIRGFNRRVAFDAVSISRILNNAGKQLLRTSQKMVPVDTGNLKGSGYVRKEGVGFFTEVEVGYTAVYGIRVHESVAMKLKGQKRRGSYADGTPKKGKYWDPQGKAQAKFLETPYR